MIKVLHYIDNLKPNDLRTDSIKILIKAEQNYAEIALAANYKDFQKLVKEEKPNIVHLHFCWNKEVYRCAKWAVKQNIPIVLSTFWCLNLFTLKKEQPKQKRIKTFFYLTQLIEMIDAFVLNDELERDAIIKQGWSNRVDVVKSSVLNSKKSHSKEAQEMVAFYEKVLDTSYQFAMSTYERDAVISLLAVGINQTAYHNHLSSEELLSLRSLNPEQWRHIFIYADDENVREIIDDSIQRLQLYSPKIDTKSIVRYPLFLEKSRLSIAEYKNKYGKKLEKKLFENQDDTYNSLLKNITIACYYMKELYRKKTMSLGHLCELHTLLKYHDYDEEKLKIILKDVKLYKFSCRMVQILSEFTQLDEGFMPFPPVNDRQTEQIRNIFAKRK